MTEERKAIIEIIEPYMDKTLSEGCYVKKLDTEELCFNIFNSISKCDAYDIAVRVENKRIGLVNLEEIKILGHLDITAVLKCIIRSGAFVECGEFF